MYICMLISTYTSYICRYEDADDRRGGGLFSTCVCVCVCVFVCLCESLTSSSACHEFRLFYFGVFYFPFFIIMCAGQANEHCCLC